jgi:hypothetical protein
MGEQNNVYWSMGVFSVTIIYLIIDYNRVVVNVRNSALMLGFGGNHTSLIISKF